VVATGENLKLPLHVKDVPRIDLNRWRNCMNTETKRVFDEAYENINDVAVLEEAARQITRRPRPAKLTPDDIATLEIKGRIKRITRQEVKAWCNVFTVVEDWKHRRRLITEPFLNDVLTQVGPCILPTITDIEILTRDAPAAIVTDIEWWYGHMDISPEAQPYYAFEYGDAIYMLTSVPTGSRHVPTLAQCLATTMAELISTSQCNVYIDNFRWPAHDDTEGFLRRAGTICEFLNVKTAPFLHSAVYEFLGVLCKHGTIHNEASLALSTKTREKLLAWHAQIPTIKVMRDLLAFVGLAVYASQILGIFIVPAYYVFKFLRRHNDREIDDEIEIWKCLIPVLHNWTDTLLSASPRSLSPRAKGCWVIVSDACPTGFGFWIISPTSVVAQAGQWRDQEDIHMLESRAVLQAVRDLPHQDTLTELAVVIDNTTTRHNLIRGKRGLVPKTFRMAVVTKAILDELRSKNFFLCHDPIYVSSAENFADELSRLNISWRLEQLTSN